MKQTRWEYIKCTNETMMISNTHEISETTSIRITLDLSESNKTINTMVVNEIDYKVILIKKISYT